LGHCARLHDLPIPGVLPSARASSTGGSAAQGEVLPSDLIFTGTW
jgi:hypothetical protein